MSTPLVTIRCLVYNHEPYLRQCLDGFVMQKTNFLFEAIVHDDASTDRSAEIIREYAEKYPDIIKPIFETENQYSKHDGSIGRIMNEHTRGKYVAICEGDDYWIDEFKLQKQVDILRHNNIGLCYTRARIYNQREKKFQSVISFPYENFQSLLIRNPIATLTVMYKKELYDSYIKEIKLDNKKWLMGDYPLWLWIASQKDIFFLDDITAVYRYLDQSASHLRGNIQKQLAFNKSIKDIQLYYASKFNMDNYLTCVINDEYYRRVAYDYMIDMERIYSIDALKKIVRKSFFEKVKIIIFHFPFLFKLYVRNL